MSDYDDRPNWREIDRKKDKSRHYGRAEEKGQTKHRPDANRWEIGRRKEALDRLFKGEKGTLEHDKLLNKIHKAYGTNSFIASIKAYADKYGVPEDFSTLMLFLDSGDQGYIIMAVDKLREVLDNLSNRQREDVKRKLSIIRMTHKSNDIREKAEEFLEGL
ncbi:MAG: hypothetical protein N3D15_02880 [Syntrophorhabdaceae bacterium]|nr:hypothetical protein [Syntrophorhabdaceae bacterium]